MAKKTKDAIPFQIPHQKPMVIWFIKSGKSVYLKLQPVPYKMSKPDIGKFKIHFYVGFYRLPCHYLYPKT